MMRRRGTFFDIFTKEAFLNSLKISLFLRFEKNQQT